MRFLRIVGLVSLIGLVGCAPTPESIRPAYVSSAPYMGWTCNQLSQAAYSLANQYAYAADQQSRARSNDEWGVIIVGVPTASIAGDNIAPEIANIKGQQYAVTQAEITKNCAALPPAPASP